MDSNIFSFSKALIFNIILSLSTAAVIFGQVPSELDRTFYAGRTTTKLGLTSNVFKATAIQPDGKILATGFHYNGSRTNAAVARFNADGSLDKTFSGDGKLSLALGELQADANAVAIQSDGKILIAGYMMVEGRRDFMVARLNADGSFDNSFSGDGVVSMAINNNLLSEIAEIALQHDGKIVVAGQTATSFNFDYDFALARFNKDGSNDVTFGNGGVTTMAFGTGGDYVMSLKYTGSKLIVAGYTVNAALKKEIAIARFNMNGAVDMTFSGDGKVSPVYPNTDAVASQVTTQGDGKIVVGGFVNLVGKDNFLVLRYNTDGSIDGNFGNGGGVITSFGGSKDGAWGVAVQSDGKIIAGGSAITAGSEHHFAAVRYLANGALDSTFDGDGKVSFPIGGYPSAYTMALQPDNKAVLVGVTQYPVTQETVIARLNTNGSLDNGFGNRVFTHFSKGDDHANAVAVQPDGKIIAAGFNDNGTNKDFALARYNADGLLDTSFGTSGRVTTAIGNGHDEARAIAVLPSGKILVAGYATVNNINQFALVCYNADGTLDLSFDGDGKVLTAVGATHSIANAMAVQTDGKIVLAGTASNAANWDFAVARYLPNGTLDAGFDADGKLVTPISNLTDTARAIVIQADGKIVIGGDGYNGGSNRDFVLVRYNASGALDINFDNDGKSFVEMGSSNDIVNALAIQADGKIIAAGQGGSPDLNFALARYTTDGFLDTDFDVDGRIYTNFSFGSADAVRSMAIQTDGKIVVGGTTAQNLFISAAFARYNADGTLDGQFDASPVNPVGDGKTTIQIGESSDMITAIAIQSSGRIIAAGYGKNGVDDDFQLIRLNGTSPLQNVSFIPVRGRVSKANGDGLGRVTVSLTLPDGETRKTLSDAAGNYRFENIPAGQTYVLSVSSERFNFGSPTQVRQIDDETSDVDFVSDNN